MSDNEQTERIKSRPELDHFQPYKAGLSIEQIKRQHGLRSVIKLASNENPFGPSPKAVAAVKKRAGEVNRYPDSQSTDLRRMIADKFKHDFSQVIIGAGSDEIIELLAKAYLTPDSEVVISESSFIQYQNAAKIMGARVVAIPMKNLTHDLASMARACGPKTKIVFIANPNNPTGTYNTEEEVDEFLSLLPPHVLPVFDEAYYEYARIFENYPHLTRESSSRPIMVLRTFSKVFGMAGLRVGYGIGPEWVIRELDKIRPPFNVSAAAQAGAEAALFDSSWVEKSVRINEEEKQRVMKALEELEYEAVPSAANFILFKTKKTTGRELFEKLLYRGIIARSVDEYGLPNYLRVSIGTPSENKKFIQVLSEVEKES